MADPKIEIRARTRTDATNETVTVYAQLYGHPITMQRVTDWLEENVPEQVYWSDIEISGGQLIWTEPAKPEETAAWNKRDADARAQHEKWERETYERLRAKFEEENHG